MPNVNVAIHDPEVYKLRAMEMLALRIRGTPDAEIAAHFKCSQATVMRSLAFAGREGLVQQYEQKIISDLASRAIGVYDEALKQGDKKVAADVIARIVQLGDRYDKREQHTEKVGIEAYFAKKRERDNQVIKDSNDNRDTITVTVEPLPAAEAEDDKQLLLFAPGEDLTT